MALNTGFNWEPDVFPNVRFKPVSNTAFRKMGLSYNPGTHVSDLYGLRQSPPNIIIAESKKSLGFIQNHFKDQSLQKGVKYVMGLGVYQQLHADQRNKNRMKYLKPSAIKFKNIYRPYIGQELHDKTLLIFRTGGIGDLLFIQPNLLYLKEKYPTCKIKFACGPQYQSMVETWDCVDEVLDLPFAASHLIESDYHALFEGVIERCKLAENVNSYNLFSEWLGLNLPDEYLIPKQNAKPEMVEFCQERLDEWNIEKDKFILLQARASSPIRTPRPDFWLEIIDSLTDDGYNVILTDSPRQAKQVDSFISYMKNKDKVFNFCQYSKSLDYSIAMVKLAGVVVATDSAMNHIAASLDVPCFGIYGPFPGYIRLKTYPKAKWVDAQKSCTPCFVHGQTPCKNAGGDGFSPCYDNLDKRVIVEGIEELCNYD